MTTTSKDTKGLSPSELFLSYKECADQLIQGYFEDDYAKAWDQLHALISEAETRGLFSWAHASISE